MSIAIRKLTAAGLLLIPLLLLSAIGMSCLTYPTLEQEVWVDLGSLTEFPADGEPRLTPVFREHHNAWTELSPQRVGAVFVRRNEANELSVLEAMDRRRGDVVRYDHEAKRYQSCCYRVQFDLRGQMLPDDRKSLQPAMKMDSFDTVILADHVWIAWKPY